MDVQWVYSCWLKTSPFAWVSQCIFEFQPIWRCNTPVLRQGPRQDVIQKDNVAFLILYKVNIQDQEKVCSSSSDILRYPEDRR